ncbi:unnamed protein product [[Actinomadura] parvosata subsp. kistnae]|nr:unnamed protein product [Actinomadura parvosata subsp. kistnae]
MADVDQRGPRHRRRAWERVSAAAFMSPASSSRLPWSDSRSNRMVSSMSESRMSAYP